MAVVVVVAGLSLAYRDLRPMSANSAPPQSANDPDNLSAPPNWKVESADSRVRWRTNAESNYALPTRYGVPTSGEPPRWVRRTDKVAATAPTYLPKNRTIESPHITFLPTPVPALAPIPVRTASLNRTPVPLPQSNRAIPAKPTNSVKTAKTLKTEPMVTITAHASNSRAGLAADPVDEEHRVLLKHAKFLINAGLAPMAQEPLRQIIREAPGTSLAREARATLDTIRN
jgi:hypothetical protein